MQWIPNDPELWQLDRYPDFLEARRSLLAEATNRFLNEPLQGSASSSGEPPFEPATATEPAASPAAILGRVESDEEEQRLVAANAWVVGRGLPEGALANARGFRYFTDVVSFQRYVEAEMLAVHGGERHDLASHDHRRRLFARANPARFE